MIYKHRIELIAYVVTFLAIISQYSPNIGDSILKMLFSLL